MPGTDRRWPRVRVQAMVVEGLHGQRERPGAPMWADAAGSGYRRRHRRDAGVVNVLQTRHLAAPARLSARSALLVHAILVHTAQVRFSSRILSRVCRNLFSSSLSAYDISMCMCIYICIYVYDTHIRCAILNIPVPLLFPIKCFLYAKRKSQKKAVVKYYCIILEQFLWNFNSWLNQHCLEKIAISFERILF